LQGKGSAGDLRAFAIEKGRGKHAKYVSEQRERSFGCTSLKRKEEGKGLEVSRKEPERAAEREE